THYGDKSYETVISENNIAYASDAGTISYSYDYESETPTDSVKFNDETVLSSAYSYDSENNITNKKLSYYAGNEWVDLNVYNQYDDNGNISASGYDGEESYTYYTYDNNNQLLRADYEYYGFTAVYTYDERGNITSRNEYSFTRDEEIDTYHISSDVYTYDNEQWLDQLTAVNDTPLTYDANGNLASYGDTTYTWSHGKWLDTITDGDDTYSYTYDENGIRASKTVNGVKTEFNTLNGLLLSQKTGNDFIYFQYDTNGTPIGFVYNDTQYLYMTNQLGDVIGITDAQGKELVEYEYDEWGSMLDITLKSDDETVSTLAELNPLRYRGYYYDNETGMYYLQSRYYNPEWGRFISADDFSNIDTSKKYFNMNAYIYC
ncbi:MAG: hypothetical protein K2F67_03000, partial [Eubacterium sp.]|nr:hypothetical protein [Eubacterium sp.]